ncbi:3-phosphoglycerate dehydrogenase [Spirochaeta lutea]|uniref:3-phosphoglycerate dehydrogenase n=2 Tax=Spirochaeta lutea TaxID=1480694 RepID=A0A098QVZ5_9SPIO|nr:phosphoglycerate dehydrogenase [Spirochaeta lutea]KGE71583.1 3-phosphoglycerate dehydrogenase [Spirochaeta lutea]
MYTIQTLNEISDKGLSLLPKDRYQISSDATDPDGIILRSFKMHDMEMSESLKAVARAGAGVNNIPLDVCTQKGIVVFNTPGANANSVKELVLTGMLISSRKIHDSITWSQTLKGKGAEVGKLVEKGKKNFAGPEILGKRLAVVGLGAIGVMVANAAVALGMEVYGFDPYISVESAWGLSRAVKRANSLEACIADADFLTIHVPLLDSTKHMVNDALLNKAKSGLRLLNFARGELVDNQAVIRAIEAGKVSAYVTDFPSDELLGVDGVIPIPHLGASTPEAEENCAIMAAQELAMFLETGNIKNSVNFPDCQMDFTGNTRLLIANKNIPNMVGQITTILAEESINIADMINKHRGEVAYNIIDLDGTISDAALGRIRSIEGILMTRVLTR